MWIENENIKLIKFYKISSYYYIKFIKQIYLFMLYSICEPAVLLIFFTQLSVLFT